MSLAAANEPEYSEFQAALLGVEYVEPEQISMPWWWFVAIPMVGFVLLKGFWFMREDHSVMHLVQLFLGTVLVFLPVANIYVWEVGLLFGGLFLLTFGGIRSWLFSRKDEGVDGGEEMLEEWVMEHLEASGARKREVEDSGMRVYLREDLMEQGWLQVTAVWLHGVRYVKYARSGEVVVIAEQAQMPVVVSGGSRGVR